MIAVVLQRPYRYYRDSFFTGRPRHLGPRQLAELQRLSPHLVPPLTASPFRSGTMVEAVEEGYRLAHVGPQAGDGRVLVGGVRPSCVPRAARGEGQPEDLLEQVE